MSETRQTDGDSNGILMGRLEELLAYARRECPTRHRVIGHLEEAIRCMGDTREGIAPEDLHSANDG